MGSFWDRLFREMPVTEQAWGWSPFVDITSTDEHIQVKAELSGLNSDDINVDVTGNVLTIRGEKKIEEEQEEERYLFRERYFGSFKRSFRLPANVESDKVSAEFNDGILKIDIPKAEESKQKKIEIKTG